MESFKSLRLFLFELQQKPKLIFYQKKNMISKQKKKNTHMIVKPTIYFYQFTQNLNKKN